MSALTLVMKELVDMNAEEFVNVRAYHIRGKGFKLLVRDDEPLTSPTNSDSSGISSLVSTNSDEERTTSTSSSVTTSSTSSRKSGLRKEQRSKFVAKKSKQALLTDEKKDIKIMFGGRNILNLERNLQLHQWQLRSPLANSYSPFGSVNQRSSFRFIEKFGALEELMVSCDQCDFHEPIQF